MTDYKPEPIAVFKTQMAVIVKIGSQEPCVAMSLEPAMAKAINNFIRNLFAEAAKERKHETVSKNPSKT